MLSNTFSSGLRPLNASAGTDDGTMSRMNERTEFLRYFRSEFIQMVDRLGSMTETEVLDGLSRVKVARNIYKEEFSERIKAIQTEPRERHRVAGVPRNPRDEFAYLSSIHVFVNSLNKLRTRMAESARPDSLQLYAVHPYSVFGPLEAALNERLGELRRRPSSDS
jgi:hypothetical protein